MKVIIVPETFLKDYYIKEVFFNKNKNKPFIEWLKLGISIKYNIPIDKLIFDENSTVKKRSPYIYLNGQEPEECNYYTFRISD